VLDDLQRGAGGEHDAAKRAAQVSGVEAGEHHRRYRAEVPKQGEEARR
jgi:hypothetical protein